MRPLRVGVIGAGFGKAVLAPAFQSLQACQVMAIAASRPEKAREAAMELGIPRSYGGWEALLEGGEVDLLAIAVPPGPQYSIAKAALDRSIPVLCEKPLALEEAQSRELMELARRKGVPAMVDFEFPEIPCWRECRDLLQGGSIGGLEGLEVDWTLQTYANRHRLDAWKVRTQEGGGPLFAFASHVLYHLEWFAGPIASLRCRLGPSPSDPGGRETQVLLETRSGAGVPAKVRIDTDDALRREHSLRFQGKGGVLLLENKGNDHVKGFRLSGPGSREAGPEGPAGDGRIAAVARLADRLVKWVREGEASRPDLSEGHRVQGLLSKALGSHRAGGVWLDTGEVRD